MNIEIATRDIRHGNRIYQPADRVPPEDFDERTIGMLRQQGQVVPLTRDNYANTVARHPQGHVARGFTAEKLIELGIIDEVPVAAEKIDLTGEVGELIPYRGHHIRAKQNGDSNFYLYDPLNQDGSPMRDKSFRGLDRAKEFIDAALGGPE